MVWWTPRSRRDGKGIEGAPDFRELALFRLPEASGFDATRPFRLELLVRRERDDGTSALVSFATTYTPPEAFIERPSAPEASTTPLWHEAWRDRTVDIAIVGAALLVLTGILSIAREATSMAPTMTSRAGLWPR